VGYLLSIIAFLILLPIILKLPVGIKTSSKIVILSIALVMSIFGVFASPYLGLLKMTLVLALLTFILVILLEKRMVEEVHEYPSSENITSSHKSKNRNIIVQEQHFEKEETKTINDIPQEAHKETMIEDVSEEPLFLDQRDALFEAQVSSNEAASTVDENVEDESDWLDNVLELPEDEPEEKMSDSNETIIEESNEKLEANQSSWLNDISELSDLEEDKQDERDEINHDVRSNKFSVDEIEEIDNKQNDSDDDEIEEFHHDKKDFIVDEIDEIEELNLNRNIQYNENNSPKIKIEEKIINLEELEELDELQFQTKDTKK